MLGTVKMEGHETPDWSSYYTDAQEVCQFCVMLNRRCELVFRFNLIRDYLIRVIRDLHNPMFISVHMRGM